MAFYGLENKQLRILVDDLRIHRGFRALAGNSEVHFVNFIIPGTNHLIRPFSQLPKIYFMMLRVYINTEIYTSDGLKTASL